MNCHHVTVTLCEIRIQLVERLFSYHSPENQCIFQGLMLGVVLLVTFCQSYQAVASLVRKQVLEVWKGVCKSSNLVFKHATQDALLYSNQHLLTVEPKAVVCRQMGWVLQLQGFDPADEAVKTVFDAG